jgi:hypothetical protein
LQENEARNLENGNHHRSQRNRAKMVADQLLQGRHDRSMALFFIPIIQKFSMEACIKSTSNPLDALKILEKIPIFFNKETEEENSPFKVPHGDGASNDHLLAGQNEFTDPDQGYCKADPEEAEKSVVVKFNQREGCVRNADIVCAVGELDFFSYEAGKICQLKQEILLAPTDKKSKCKSKYV